MEDLQSLMACIDEISSQIPDGIYLKMADQMKRVHDHMNGNKPIHEDTFYYSDDDSEFESDDDSDSDFEVPTVENRRLRERAYQKLRDEIFGLVKQMHAEYKVLKKWDKQVNCPWTPIKRMTTWRKGRAIMTWCDSRELVCGCTDQFAFWTWEKLTEYGMKMIVFEIGTEAEKVSASRGFICQDDLSLKTLQKLPAFEKQIYGEYKEESHRKWNSCVEDAKKKVKESEEKMNTLEKACIQREYQIDGFLRDCDCRDYWDLDTYLFTIGRTIL